ncbi:Zn-dependent peptidase ImmA (M78 family)/transcriptional regulator with XRE-family HTH domain [Aminobacter niigataensis]|uniref:Zn-dependent peptidase ImmA (M78 family)/transcriptional regulator with XRE-family HTH domain n=1 Tax=Aminobacter niigataensis TaxID=83265 RepID=A0ABR6KVA4_9HYPH|nr:XRE family transcriptional regulator [Aminobacter niigataensis]MBB4648442.1 Zn-dependent peptidase ImmA (M78 family)/transcriptional regulator with XRE-family HTH domain [Aminobacter niigataensis]
MQHNGLRFDGEQLRLARLTFGLSLEQIATEVSATRQYIHQLETGARSPADGMIEALADALGVQSKFFFMTGASNVGPEQCHFRKQLTTPASVTSQVLARGTLLDRLAEQLGHRLSLPSVNFPDIPVDSLDDVERAAEETRRYWRLGSDGPITNMTRVVENAGAIVTYFHGLSERVDALSMDRPRPIIVRSDAKASLCRQRFDLAHECGHLVMHRGVETGDKRTETQAHFFAGAFLFPRGAFLRDYPRGRSLNWAVLFQLKLRWKISVRAMVRRAFDLGVIDAAQYRTANIQIVKTGQAKNEKYDDKLPLDQPELLDKAIDFLSKNSHHGLHTLADDMGFASGMFKLLTGNSLHSVRPIFDDPKVIMLDSRKR